MSSILGLFLFIQPVSAKDLYVDAAAPLGGDGTIDSPLQTLNEAFDRFQLGEANTVYATGNFTEFVYLTAIQGGTSEETRTTFRDWPLKPRPVLDVTNGDREGDPVYNAFHMDNADYVTVRGFEVMGGLATDIWFTNGSAYGIAEDNITHHSGVKGICFRDAPDGKILNNVSYENKEFGIFVPELQSDRVLVEGNRVYANGISGIEARNGADDVTIRNNEVYNNNTTGSFNGGGIVVEGSRGEIGATIEGNNIHDEIKGINIGPRNQTAIRGNRIERTSDTGISVREGGSNLDISLNQLMDAAFGIQILRTPNVTMDANVVTGTTSRPAVSLQDASRVLLTNNRLVENQFTALNIRGANHVFVKNNTFAKQSTAIRLEGLYEGGAHVRVYNNVFYDHQIVYSISSVGHDLLTAGNNAYSVYRNYLVGHPQTWTPERACDQLGVDCSSLNNVDPRFMDPVAGDYHLSSDSPLIDAARADLAPATDMDGQSRLDDRKADIGADEFSS